MLPLDIIGPGIATAINLALGVWALGRGPRMPAYRLFALFALALILWNIGERFPHGPRDPAIWLRLAFLGMSLAPAAFMSLAISALEPQAVGRYWRILLFLPALGIGLFTEVNAEELARHELQSGFYNVTQDAALVFAAFAVLYIGAGLGISYAAAKKKEENGWVFRLALLPLSVGLALILAAAWLRRETAPTLVFWMMVMAQVAMFLMIRFRMVELAVGQTRRNFLFFSALIVGSCLLLLGGLVSTALVTPLDQETVLILVISTASLLMLYAALIPKLEELARGLFGKK